MMFAIFVASAVLSVMEPERVRKYAAVVEEALVRRVRRRRVLEAQDADGGRGRLLPRPRAGQLQGRGIVQVSIQRRPQRWRGIAEPIDYRYPVTEVH